MPWHLEIRVVSATLAPLWPHLTMLLRRCRRRPLQDNKSSHPSNRFFLERGCATPGGVTDGMFAIQFAISKQNRTWQMLVDSQRLHSDWLTALEPWARK